MFSQNVKILESIVKTMCFECLQVEGVNGKRCQEKIKIDAKNHAKINGKTMLDLCWTNDATIIGKYKQSKPKGSQQMTNCRQQCIEKTNQNLCRTNIEKYSKTRYARLPNPP